MNSNANHIILVGLPGSGKSTLGKALATTFDFPFVDLDTAIEQAEGMPVPQLFARKGETYFRKAEAAMLRSLLSSSEPFVLATGGGAPCFFENMERIRQQSCSIYLEVPFEELAGRLLAQGVAKRPLLEGVDSKEALVELLKEKFSYRIPTYKKAGLHFLNTAGTSADDLVQKVQACLNKAEND